MSCNGENTWIVIPAYNEGTAIEAVIENVQEQFPNVIVVDDASGDETGAVAKAAGAKVVRHPFNLGQGAALQTGFEYAIAQGAEFLVTFDADGQHHIEDVPVMLEALQATESDIALGSRFLGETIGMSFVRGLLLRTATLFTIATTGLRLTDCHNGLRVMTAEAAGKMNLRQNRMAHASEILANIQSLKLRYTEVPVTISYSDYSKEKGQTMGDALVIFRDLIAARLIS